MVTVPPAFEASGLPPGIEPLAVHEDIAVLSSNRLHGNMDPRFSVDYPQVLRNRIKLASLLAANRIVCMVPQNGTTFHDLDKQPLEFSQDDFAIWPENIRPKNYYYDPSFPAYMADLPTDGLITAQHGVGLMLNAADCSPLVMYDTTHKVLALAHVGRVGASEGIARRILAEMSANYDTKPDAIAAYFGPSVSNESYLLEYISPALQTETWKPFVTESPAGYKVNLVGYAAQQLIEDGVASTHILYSDVDTGSNDDYFSLTQHRAAGQSAGRNGFIASIR
jgi:copper oxidase (laccase) domain-containing protein